MPKRTDIQSILIVGAGPIIIGQASEFDYSGVQACKALREEGYRVILVNSNPATIMTDPGMADATYIEPITPATIEKIIARERPDALLPTMGGQTALNVGMELFESGALERYGVEMIGAKAAAIVKAEDRQLFRDAMTAIGLDSPTSRTIRSMDEALGALREIGLPLIIRPSFTLGGTGGGIAYNADEFERIVAGGLAASPTRQVLIEESVLGWKEFEMEVVRDSADNCIIVCSIENVDPMGVHTGDSITVAPALTLTDKEYQIMRNASIAVLREIGVDTGGSNVQFAINPDDGRMVIIEMNPRVSRSSALASKATGFPIAKVAAKLAVGYHLDELKNDITGTTPASFEPTIDYIVVKIPRFTFEKFPGAEPILTTSMKSVGEAMAIGRCFAEALQKGLRSMETGLSGFNEVAIDGSRDEVLAAAGAAAPRSRAGHRRGFPAWSRHRQDLRRLPVRSLVPGADQGVDRDRGRGDSPRPSRKRSGAVAAEEPRLFRPAPCRVDRQDRGGSCPPPAPARRDPRLQAGGHLRRRVPGQHRVHVFDLRERSRARCGMRGAALGTNQGGHPRRGSQSHRPRHRIRLLLRACRVRAQGGRLRGDHGQL